AARRGPGRDDWIDRPDREPSPRRLHPLLRANVVAPIPAVRRWVSDTRVARLLRREPLRAAGLVPRCRRVRSGSTEVSRRRARVPARTSWGDVRLRSGGREQGALRTVVRGHGIALRTRGRRRMEALRAASGDPRRNGAGLPVGPEADQRGDAEVLAPRTASRGVLRRDRSNARDEDPTPLAWAIGALLLLARCREGGRRR